jgi:death-on-curing protein
MTRAQEIIWVLEQTVLAIHQRQIAEHGGNPDLRDEGLLESALSRPRNPLVYGESPPDLAALAASYAFGLARNHPFVDGNKRVSLVVSRLFLLLNGADINASHEEKYRIFLHLAEGSVTEESLAQWFRDHLKTRPTA